MGHGAARCKNATAAAPAEAEATGDFSGGGEFGGETSAPAVAADGGW